MGSYPNVFTQLVPTFVEHDQFEIVDGASPEFCEAFENLATKPAHRLFGDHGWKRPGYGGISSYGVLKVREGVDVHLYGTRQAADMHHPWFCDSRALGPGV